MHATKKSLQSTGLAAVLLLSGILLPACAPTTQTGQGAQMGAVVGGVIGGVVGSGRPAERRDPRTGQVVMGDRTGEGVLIGAAIGAVLGAAVGAAQDEAARREEERIAADDQYNRELERIRREEDSARQAREEALAIAEGRQTTQAEVQAAAEQARLAEERLAQLEAEREAARERRRELQEAEERRAAAERRIRELEEELGIHSRQDADDPERADITPEPAG